MEVGEGGECVGYVVSGLGVPKTLYTCWPNCVAGEGGDEADSASSAASAWAQSQVGVN